MKKRQEGKMRSNIVESELSYGYRKLIGNIQFLQYEFRDIPCFEIGSIGTSTLKKKIPYMQIGKGNRSIFVNAAHHANEWLTSLVSMMFLEKILNLFREKSTYKTYAIYELLQNTKLFFVPMVNPDGVDLVVKEPYIFQQKEYLNLIFKNYGKIKNWKANIRGVDLNLNYPAKWEKAKNAKRKKGISYPHYRDYVGPNPLSEVETQNMVSLSNILQFDLSISLHSQGEEIYWDDFQGKIPKSKEIGEKFAAVSGYTLTKPEIDSSYAGYKDWFVERFQKPGYTIEIGKGNPGEPLPISQAGEILEKIEEIFLVALEEIGK